MKLSAASFGVLRRRADPAIAAIAAVFAALAVAAPDQAAESALFTGRSLFDIAPFLLASVAIAAYVKASGAEHLIAAAFKGREVVMVVTAAVMGAVSPFCSCGVIPLIAALLSIGVPLGPVMAFWLASPIMDPAMFVLTAGTLGAGFAVAKTVAAIALGMAGGMATLALARTGLLADSLRPEIGNGGCAGAKIRQPKPVVWKFWSEPARRASFAAGARDNAIFLGKWLALAFLLESLMLAWLPADLVVRVAGGDGMLPVLLAALVGVPAYLNGYAALPLVGGLLEQGMAPGAAMAFLVAGGVTSIPAAIAVYALVKPRVFALYIAFSLSGAVLAGMAWAVVA